MVFLDVIVNQVETQHELTHVWATRAERLENLFTNVSVRVHQGGERPYKRPEYTQVKRSEKLLRIKV